MVTCGSPSRASREASIHGVLWGGVDVDGAQSFFRFYGEGVERERKNFIVRGVEVYYRGKRCKTGD